MTVRKGVEQGGPGPMIPAREAGDLITSADEHSILAARIHGPLYYGGILRARSKPVMLRAGAGSGMHHRGCSASLLVQRPPVGERYLRGGADHLDLQRSSLLGAMISVRRCSSESLGHQ
jgi:hypothetical protein